MFKTLMRIVVPGAIMMLFLVMPAQGQEDCFWCGLGPFGLCGESNPNALAGWRTCQENCSTSGGGCWVSQICGILVGSGSIAADGSVADRLALRDSDVHSERLGSNVFTAAAPLRDCRERIVRRVYAEAKAESLRREWTHISI